MITVNWCVERSQHLLVCTQIGFSVYSYINFMHIINSRTEDFAVDNESLYHIIIVYNTHSIFGEVIHIYESMCELLDFL